MVSLDFSKMQEQDLMPLLVSNDIGAWSELVKRYGKLVYSICFQVLKNNSDTEDAVQNTFVNLKLYASKFDPSQQLKPWLARIASIEAIRIYNKKKYINKKESVRMDTPNKSHQSQRRDASEIVEQKEVEVMVKKAIETLPDTSRVALTLYYAGGMNQTEIADQLGISQVRISMTIKSGLEKVREYLRKAGVNAAIIISPNLIQEGVFSINPPQALIQKIISHLPTEIQLAKATSLSVRIGVQVSGKKSGFLWLWYLLGLTSVLSFVYFNLPVKTEPQIFTVIKKPDVVGSSKEIFIPIKFDNYTPIYFKMGKIQTDSSKLDQVATGPVIHVGGTSNWSVQGNNIKRNLYEKGTMDGLYINSKFNQGCFLTGIIKIDSINDRTGFILTTPLKSKEEHQTLIGKENSTYNVTDRNGQIGDINTDEKSEIEFKIYIWPFNNTWKSISFFKSKNKSEDGEFMINSLDFTSQSFKIGVFSTGKTEFKDFNYSLLASNWDPLLEPNIKEVVKDIPKDFFGPQQKK